MTPLLFYAACLLAGVPLGLLLKPRAEKRLRGNGAGWMPFGAESGARLAASLAVIIVVGLVLCFVFFELLLGAARRVQMADDLGTAFAACVAGAAVGMGCRFLYWRRRDPWRSGWF